MTKNVAKSVSAIDDAEIKGYFNTRKEMIYKKIIWEVMNKEYLQGKREKREEPRNKKNKKSAAERTNDESKKKKRVEHEMEEKKKMKKQRLGSKINFDVLEKQEGEEEKGGRKVETETEVSEKYVVETEENYSEENEQNDYENVYYEGEKDEEQGYNFDEDYDFEDY